MQPRNTPRAFKLPGRSWQASTTAAQASYESGVTESIRDKRFAKGVQAAGDQKWQQKSISKGAPRFAGGVQEAESDYQKGVAPYLEVLNNLQLPPRGPKGDPKNIQRVVAVAQALRNKKLGK